MTRLRSDKRREKIGLRESGRRGKRKVDEVQKDPSSKRHKSELSVTKSPAKKVQQPNDSEMWFNIAGRFVRFSILEFCLVTGLRNVSDADTSRMDKTPSHLKILYFPTLKNVTHEDVKEAFLGATDIPDEDV
ncbi:Hypothetical predicted protein [Olea europaea subsp. europaea]|uniref:DUF1985 domain-containing protein n=1 Tax=Olea europaea subsp. europaea TaxID=158383 RepID=A0A8S0SLZ6_OLEEU|nr:Hypothetical predicted protein [Olea europaea subsp. europaea]